LPDLSVNRTAVLPRESSNGSTSTPKSFSALRACP
jgi:hypothetical protein